MGQDVFVNKMFYHYLRSSEDIFGMGTRLSTNMPLKSVNNLRLLT